MICPGRFRYQKRFRKMLSSRIPITSRGAEKLKAELEYLKKTARPAVVAAIAEA
ncbi:hypothetical protein EVA_09324, partial [gut metagenome]